MITFNEGRKLIAQSGFPATCYFLLSSRDEATHAVTDTLIGGVGEIAGTGYARQSQAVPVPTSANPTALVFALMSFATGANTNWATSPAKTVVLVTNGSAATDVANSGKAIAAWNLNGTTGRPVNAANTTVQATPTLNLQ